MTHRRFTCARIAAGVLALNLVGAASEPAAAADKKITFALSDQMRVGYYWLYLPQALGYWKAEGLEVDIVPTSGSVEAMQQVAAGRAQFGQMGANIVVVANANQNIPAQLATLNGVFSWKLAVLPGKGIAKPADLKGKSVGVFSLATNGNLFLKPFLASQGLEVDKDVKLVPVGFGGPALNAISKDEVSALYFWPSAFTTFENQGYKFEFFSSPDWHRYPDYAVATLKSVVASDPELVLGFVRGMAKAMVFAEANPTCAVRLYWKSNPDGKPTGIAEDVALAQNVKVISGQIAEQKLAAETFGKELVGNVDAAGMSRLQDFLFESGQIKSKVDPAQMVVGIPDFFAKANGFDKAAIESAAKTCSG